MHLTPKQIKAARAMLDWSRAELAAASDVSEANIVRLEAGGDSRKETLEKIHNAFESHGIVFTQTGGIEPARPELRTFVGQNGFRAFFDDVYATIRDMGGEVVIIGSDEDDFIKAFGNEFLSIHKSRMEKLKNFNMRCLIEEGDMNFLATEYCTYKWSPREQFQSVPFYIYGNKVAFIQFNVPVDAPLIVVVQSKAIADAFRLQFDGMWKNSKIPPDNKGVRQ